MLTADMQKAIEARMRAISIFDTLGFEIGEIAEGRCVARVPRQPHFDGAFETFHGGIVQTACDSLAWATILTKAGPDAHLATTDMHIRFLAPCLTGVTLKSRLIKFGRTLCPVEIEVFDEAGTLVAISQVTYMRVDASAPGRRAK